MKIQRCLVAAVVAGLLLLPVALAGAQDTAPAMPPHPIVGTWVFDAPEGITTPMEFAMFIDDGAAVAQSAGYGLALGTWEDNPDDTVSVMVVFRDLDPAPAVVSPGVLRSGGLATLNPGAKSLAFAGWFEAWDSNGNLADEGTMNQVATRLDLDTVPSWPIVGGDVAIATIEPAATESPAAGVTPTPTVQPGHVLYNSSNDGFVAWHLPAGWNRPGGHIVCDGTAADQDWARPLYQPNDLSDYAIEASIAIAQAGPAGSAFGLGARITPDQSGYEAGIFWDKGTGSSRAQIRGLAVSDQPFDPGSGWHTYRFEVQGNQLRLSIDGFLMVEAVDDQFAAGGAVGLSCGPDVQISVRSFTVRAV